LDLFEQHVAQRRDALGAGDQHQVETSGAHCQVLDAGNGRELGSQRPPVVLLDVDEDQSGDTQAQRLRIDDRSEPVMMPSSRSRCRRVWAVDRETLIASARSVKEILHPWRSPPAAPDPRCRSVDGGRVRGMVNRQFVPFDHTNPPIRRDSRP
jgi:hypothetical protein